MKKLLKFLVVCLLSLPIHVSATNEEISKEDLLFLPKFCWGTQAISGVSGDKTPIETYMRIYGKEYYHLHHYCWALYEERKAMSAPLRAKGDEMFKNAWLGRSLDNIEYVLKKSRDEFILMPDMLVTYARVLNSLGRTHKAIEALDRAIRIKPDFIRAYVSLADLYQERGDHASAVTTLQEGLRYMPGSTLIMDRLRSLGATPDPRYTSPVDDSSGAAGSGSAKPLHGGAPPKMEGATVKSGDQPQKSNANGSVQDYAQPGDNPYCRFCAD